MELIFGMVRASFEFFVDLGNKVDFMGLNLWHISFIFFVASTMVRFFFPILFSGTADTSFLRVSFSEADTVDDSRNVYVHSGAPELGSVSSRNEGSNSLE